MSGPSTPQSAEQKAQRAARKAAERAHKEELQELKLKKTRAPRVYSCEEFVLPVDAHIKVRIPSIQGVLQPLMEEERERKRNFSETSIESVIEQRKAKRFIGNQGDLEDYMHKQVSNHCQDRMALTENHLKQMNAVLHELNEARHSQKISLADYNKSKDTVEAVIAHARNELITIKENRRAISGTISDRILSFEEPVDEAYIDMLVGTHKVPANATVMLQLPPGQDQRAHMQGPFTAKVRGYYDAIDPESQETEGKSLWCPITRQFLPAADVKTAHIVPHSLGERHAKYIFGPIEGAEGHLFNVRNGIPLYYQLEDALDKARFAIVPVEELEEHNVPADKHLPKQNPKHHPKPQPKPVRLKVLVMDKSLLKLYAPGKTPVPWHELDGRELEFRNDNRPGLRYLYFNYLMSIFRRHRYEVTGWQEDLFRFAAARKMWSSPGGWLRRSTLMALARRVGHIQNLPALLGTDDLATVDPGDEKDDDLTADVIAQAYEERAKAHDQRREAGEEWEE